MYYSLLNFSEPKFHHRIRFHKPCIGNNETVSLEKVLYVQTLEDFCAKSITKYSYNSKDPKNQCNNFSFTHSFR
jgi:hypothetical protein